MNHINNYFQSLSKLTLATSLSLGLVACGGGGGGSDNTPVETPVVAVEPPATNESLDNEFTLYLTDLTDNHIVPAYAELETKAQVLQTQASAFCTASSPTTTALQTFQQSWLDMNQAWQTIQWLRLGPVLEESRLLRIQFWEPGTNAVSNGVEALLLRQGEIIDAELISGINVGAQGLPALEYLLYPENSNDSLLSAPDQDKRCEIATAISLNLLSMTTDIHSQWLASGGNYRETLITGINEFTSIQDAVEELVTLWLEHINIVKDDKILAGLDNASPGINQNAEHYLSDESLNSIAVNLATFLTIYNAGEGQGFDDILTDALDQQIISNQVNTDITAAIARVTAISQDLTTYSAAIADEDGRTQLSELVNELNVIRDVLTIEFIQALDISTGFNATDGD